MNNMAELMSQSDLAIGAAGSTSWERCCLGLPSILCVLAENQRGIANALEKANAAVIVSGDDVATGVVEVVNYFVKTPESLKSMTHKAASIVDGEGAKRVAERLERSR